MRCPALVLRLASRCAITDGEGLVGPSGKVKQRCQKSVDLLAIAAQGQEMLGCSASFCRRGSDGGVCGEVAAILGKGRVVDFGVPIAALPTTNAVAEGVHEVVVVPKASVSAHSCTVLCGERSRHTKRIIQEAKTLLLDRYSV